MSQDGPKKRQMEQDEGLLTAPADSSGPQANGILKDLNEVIETNLKTIFMSGYAADILPEQSSRQEAIHFVQKPFKKEVLFDKIREVLAGHP